MDFICRVSFKLFGCTCEFQYLISRCAPNEKCVVFVLECFSEKVKRMLACESVSLEGTSVRTLCIFFPQWYIEKLRVVLGMIFSIPWTTLNMDRTRDDGYSLIQ